MADWEEEEEPEDENPEDEGEGIDSEEEESPSEMVEVSKDTALDAHEILTKLHQKHSRVLGAILEEVDLSDESFEELLEDLKT